MIYVRNISNRIIHLGEVMLLPDQKVPDEIPNTGEPYSEKAVIKQFIAMGMLELVDIRPLEKEKEPTSEIKVEFEEVPETEVKNSEEEKTEAPAEQKTTTTRRRTKKES